MSLNVNMQKELLFIDCAGCNCKNFQRIGTIEIFYRIKTDNFFEIEYNFHKIDFDY